MAKRKRLIPPLPSQDEGSLSDPYRSLSASAKVSGDAPTALRPGLGQPAPASPPIAQVAGHAAMQAALDEVTDAMARARAEGRLVLTLPLVAVDRDHLVRDRITLDEAELGHLMASIREHGQRTPIEVTDLGEGRAGPRYGLISGWRRLQALQRLSDETGEARFGTVLALLRRPAEASESYVAMVEENEVRQGLSYYERARIVARSVDLGVFETEKQALQRLFSTASRARRSKIGSFVLIYRQMDGALRFPAAIPERLGLALAKALESRAEAAAGLVEHLTAHPVADAMSELAILTRFAGTSPKKSGPDMAKSTVGKVRLTARELCPGVVLRVSGAPARPVLTLSGPSVDPAFRGRLEAWLAAQG